MHEHRADTFPLIGFEEGLKVSVTPEIVGIVNSLIFQCQVNCEDLPVNFFDAVEFHII